MGDILDAGARLLGVEVVVPYYHGAGVTPACEALRAVVAWQPSVPQCAYRRVDRGYPTFYHPKCIGFA